MISNPDIHQVTLAGKEVFLLFNARAIINILSKEQDDRFYTLEVINGYASKVYSGWALSTMLYFGYHAACNANRAEATLSNSEINSLIVNEQDIDVRQEAIAVIVSGFENSPALKMVA